MDKRFFANCLTSEPKIVDYYLVAFELDFNVYVTPGRNAMAPRLYWAATRILATLPIAAGAAAKLASFQVSSTTFTLPMPVVTMPLSQVVSSAVVPPLLWKLKA